MRLERQGILSAFFSGLLAAFGVAWPFADVGFISYGEPVWILQFLALVVYVVALERARSPRHAWSLGWLQSSLHLTIGLYWLTISMHTYGGMAAPLAWIAVIALALALSLYSAIAAFAYHRLKSCLESPVRVAGLFAATWLVAELARGQWLSGFGWASGAYAHISGPFSGLAPWIGAYGIVAVVALAAACAAIAIHRKSLSTVPVLVLVVAVAMASNLAPPSTSSSGHIQVALLQGNIAQDQKFDSRTGVTDALQWYGEQLMRPQAALVLAPETALPLLPTQLPPDYLVAIGNAMQRASSTTMVGIPLGNYADGYTNSVIALEGPVISDAYRYDKHHLVPFGEFVPPLFRWFVQLMQIPLGDFNAGPLQQASLQVAGQRVAPSICYEDLFAEELAVRFADPAKSPTAFANFSNLAWFEGSTAMYQHLSISRMRALEFERPLLRVANTGVTAVVDHEGRITAQLPPHTRGVLVADVEGRTGLTPFAWWSARWGQWPLWALALGFVAWCAWAARRNRAP